MWSSHTSKTRSGSSRVRSNVDMNHNRLCQCFQFTFLVCGHSGVEINFLVFNMIDNGFLSNSSVQPLTFRESSRLTPPWSFLFFKTNQTWPFYFDGPSNGLSQHEWEFSNKTFFHFSILSKLSLSNVFLQYSTWRNKWSRIKSPLLHPFAWAGPKLSETVPNVCFGNCFPFHCGLVIKVLR